MPLLPHAHYLVDRQYGGSMGGDGVPNFQMNGHQYRSGISGEDGGFFHHGSMRNSHFPPPQHMVARNMRLPELVHFGSELGGAAPWMPMENMPNATDHRVQQHFSPAGPMNGHGPASLSGVLRGSFSLGVPPQRLGDPHWWPHGPPGGGVGDTPPIQAVTPQKVRGRVRSAVTNCNHTNSPHYGRGMCRQCYFRVYMRSYNRRKKMKLKAEKEGEEQEAEANEDTESAPDGSTAEAKEEEPKPALVAAD